MASVLADHAEIRAIYTVSGNTPQTRGDITEQASQTFLKGTPVMLNAGNIKVWDAVASTIPATSTVGIAGIALSNGLNLASSGLGAPGGGGVGNLTGVKPPGTSLTFGKIPFQASAVNIIPGSPVSDGRTLLEIANADTVFEAQFDDNGGVPATATTNKNMIGKQFGLTLDATGHWFVDAAKVTVGTNTVLTIVDLNPLDGAIQNGRVYFKFLLGICQLAQA
jgi:hypothetical protein